MHQNYHAFLKVYLGLRMFYSAIWKLPFMIREVVCQTPITLKMHRTVNGLTSEGALDGWRPFHGCCLLLLCPGWAPHGARLALILWQLGKKRKAMDWRKGAFPLHKEETWAFDPRQHHNSDDNGCASQILDLLHFIFDVGCMCLRILDFL